MFQEHPPTRGESTGLDVYRGARSRTAPGVVARMVASVARSIPSGPCFNSVRSLVEPTGGNRIAARIAVRRAVNVRQRIGSASSSNRNIPYAFQKGKDVGQQIAFDRFLDRGLKPVSSSVHDDQAMRNADALEGFGHSQRLLGANPRVVRAVDQQHGSIVVRDVMEGRSLESSVIGVSVSSFPRRIRAGS